MLSLQRCGVTGCFQFLSTLHSMRPIPDQIRHCAGFHLPPFGKQELPFLLLRPRLSLCRSATFKMSQSREAPKQKLLAERTEPRCGREKRPPSPHIAAVLTPKAVASAAACREVKVNAVVMRRYRIPCQKLRALSRTLELEVIPSSLQKEPGHISHFLCACKPEGTESAERQPRATEPSLPTAFPSGASFTRYGVLTDESWE